MMLPTKKTAKEYDFLKGNCLLYGPPKVGKTTFAASINNGDGVLFLATEKGHDHVEVYKVDITSWADVYKVGKDLQTTKHNFRYLVIDIADWFYKHCEQYICDKHSVQHVTDLAYGKGTGLVKDEFVRTINKFNHMGFGLCFLSHCKEREQKKTTQTWTKMDTSLGASPSGVIAGLCDYIFYAYLDERDNVRKMRTRGTKYINAGDRSGLLPEVMPFEYKELSKYLKPENEPKKEKGNK